MSHRMRLGRRDLLAGLGAGAALSPFVPLLNRQAEAQGGVAPRLLFVFSACGFVENQFWPQGGETDFTFAPGSSTEALAPFKNKLLFPKSMHRVSSGSGAHEKNMGGLLTCCGLVAVNGYPRGPSIDHVIAQQLNAGTAFKNLQFGVQCDSFAAGGNKPVLKSMTYSASNAVVKPEDNPANMFNKLMLGNGGGPAPMGISTEDLLRAQNKRKSVLDAVRGDLKALQTRIDRDDRAKLDQHLESLAGIEKRLIQPIDPNMPSKPAGSCGGGAMPGGFNDATALAAHENFPALIDIQTKLAVAALACNRTRVATLQFSRAFSRIAHPWVGVREDHHTISHRTSANDFRMLTTIDRWYGEKIAALLKQMDAIPEGGGTLLDNTMVVWVNEANNGNHNPNTAITMVAGSGAGKLRTGRMVSLPTNDWSQFLITLAHAMGVTSLMKFGDLPMKEGPIPGLLA
jgi:hypothetical protein